jgi:hypothetical protein
MAKQISEDAGWKRLPKPSEDGSHKAGIDAAVLKSRLRAPAAARSKGLPSGAGADHPYAVYLRAAQAYMLISMPTGTSTIFGAFQVIRASRGIMARCLCRSEVKATADVTQVRALLPIR